MALISRFDLLNAARILAREKIVDVYVSPVMHALNAMHEAVTDQPPPPGTGSQTYIGHDHGMYGGAPFARQSGICEDGGAVTLHTYSPTQAKDRRALSADDSVTATTRNAAAPLHHTYTSPFLSRLGIAAPTGIVRVAYKANNSNFTLYFAEMSAAGAGREFALSLPQTTSGAVQQWVKGTGVPLASGQWSRVHIEAENDDYDSATVPSLEIYGIWVWETAGVTARPVHGGGVVL